MKEELIIAIIGSILIIIFNKKEGYKIKSRYKLVYINIIIGIGYLGILSLKIMEKGLSTIEIAQIIAAILIIVTIILWLLNDITPEIPHIRCNVWILAETLTNRSWV